MREVTAPPTGLNSVAPHVGMITVRVMSPRRGSPDGRGLRLLQQNLPAGELAVS